MAVTADRARSFSKEQGYAHPVLLDLKREYLERLAPGPIHYPAVFLIGRDGRVAWEGTTDRTAFAADCWAQLKKLLPESEAKD